MEPIWMKMVNIHILVAGYKILENSVEFQSKSMPPPRRLLWVSFSRDEGGGGGGGGLFAEKMFELGGKVGKEEEISLFQTSEAHIFIRARSINPSLLFLLFSYAQSVKREWVKVFIDSTATNSAGFDNFADEISQKKTPLLRTFLMLPSLRSNYSSFYYILKISLAKTECVCEQQPLPFLFPIRPFVHGLFSFWEIGGVWLPPSSFPLSSPLSRLSRASFPFRGKLSTGGAGNRERERAEIDNKSRKN